MKATIATLFLVSLLPSSAAVSLATQFGVAFDASDAALPDGAIWALVVDSDNNNTFAGFGLDSSIFEADQGTPGIADLFFTVGQSISVGSTVGGGRIFAMGAINGTANSLPGASIDTVNFNIGDNSTATGLDFAFYWFPGTTYVDGINETIGDEVGGINVTSNSGLFDIGMAIPADGSFTVGAATTAGGGSIPDNRFTAVTLIPEPSSALLGAFGALALLRRRRVVQG